jgi:hypothetical protein
MCRTTWPASPPDQLAGRLREFEPVAGPSERDDSVEGAARRPDELAEPVRPWAVALSSRHKDEGSILTKPGVTSCGVASLGARLLMLGVAYG